MVLCWDKRGQILKHYKDEKITADMTMNREGAGGIR